MLRLGDRLPRYLLGKFQMTATLTFVALFSLVFILVRLPFSNNVWLQVDSLRLLKYIVYYFLICLVLVIESRRLLYYRARKWKITILGYIAWCLAEVMAITFVYCAITLQAVKHGMIPAGEFGMVGLILNTFVCNMAAIGLPFLIAAMYFVITQQSNTIRMFNLSNVVSDSPVKVHEEKRFTLLDNNGTMKFSSSIGNVFFVEADDNYVQIWYSDTEGHLKQYMVRCRLKTIEDDFADSELIRCHRRYIVNISKARAIKSDSPGYAIDLGVEGIAPIPISKTYEQAVLARFNSR